MGIQLDFIGSGLTVKHLNIRKQGPEDDKILAVDVKLSGCVATGPWLRELFLPIVEDDSQFQGDLESLLWMDDEDKNLRFHGIREFKSTRTFRSCTLKFAGLDLYGDCSKFSLEPLAGQRGEITFSISVSDPGTIVVSVLAEMVGEYSTGGQLFGADLFDQQEEAA